MSGLDPVARDTVLTSNRHVEALCWLAEQALRSRVRTVGLVLKFPEELRGHTSMKSLAGVHDTSYASSPQPNIADNSGFIATINVQQKLHENWPTLAQLHKDGP